MNNAWMWPGTSGNAAQQWGNLNPELIKRLRSFHDHAQASGFGTAARPISSYRTREDQIRAGQQVGARLGRTYDPRVGIPGYAASADGSRHRRGEAIDWNFRNPEAQKWFHENAGKFGLGFPIKTDTPHMQLVDNWNGQPVPAHTPGPSGGTIASGPAQQGQDMAERKQPSLFGALANNFQSPAFMGGAVMFDSAARGGGIADGARLVQQGQQNQTDMEWREKQAAQQNLMQQQRMAMEERKLNASLMPQVPQRPWWAGPNGEVDPAMIAKTTAGRPQNNVTVNGSSQQQETAYDREMGKQYAKHKIEGDKGAATAHRELNNLRVMEKALEDPKLYTGTGAGTIQGLKKAAQSLFGLPVQGVASGEIVQNLTKFIAVGLKDNLPGPLSDSDRRFLESLPPGLLNTPEGNRRILGLGMLQKRYQIDRSRAASDYARQNGGRVDQGFDQVLANLEDQYAQKFSGMIAEMQETGEMPTRSPAAGMQLDALRKQYGLE